jgi:uncharacterized RDD family membrane protein YckC
MEPCPNHPSEYDVRPCQRCGRSFCTNCLLLLQGAYYCAECKIEQLRDVQSGTLGRRLEYASIGSRFLALLIDSLVQTAAMMVLIVPVVLLVFGGLFASINDGNGKEPSPLVFVGILLMYAYAFAVGLGIPVLYEALQLARGGQTIGKKALGIKVVTPEGNDISRGQAWGRAGIRLAIRFACSPVDYVPALFTEEKLCLHDMVASTRVIRL